MAGGSSPGALNPKLNENFGVLDSVKTMECFVISFSKDSVTFPSLPPSTPPPCIHKHSKEPCPGAAYVSITWPLESNCRDSTLQTSLSWVESELLSPSCKNCATHSWTGWAAVADCIAYPVFHVSPYISQFTLWLH